MSAIGDNAKQSELIKYVVAINSKELMMTKSKAEFALILPFGISLIAAVLGLVESISLSIYRLKAIAAERAKTIQSTTYKSVTHSNSYDFVAKKKPISANGIANIVWLNFINDKYFFILEIFIK